MRRTPGGVFALVQVLANGDDARPGEVARRPLSAEPDACRLRAACARSARSIAMAECTSAEGVRLWPPMLICEWPLRLMPLAPGSCCEARGIREAGPGVRHSCAEQATPDGAKSAHDGATKFAPWYRSQYMQFQADEQTDRQTKVKTETDSRGISAFVSHARGPGLAGFWQQRSQLR